MTNKGRDQRLRITVDADGYRARRAQTLTAFAQNWPPRSTATGQEAITDPLNPMERRIIHTALVDHPDVETYSEGDEPNRYVVVSPAHGRAAPDNRASWLRGTTAMEKTGSRLFLLRAARLRLTFPCRIPRIMTVIADGRTRYRGSGRGSAAVW